MDARGRLTTEAHVDESKWVRRWKYLIAVKPSRPGVWRRKEGGYLVRGRAVDCRTGRMKDILRVVDASDPGTAYRFLQEELNKLRTGGMQEEVRRVRFDEYAASLFERLVAKRKIKSAKTKQLWEMVLRLHLFPRFGSFFVDAIQKRDVEGWVAELAGKVSSEEVSPVSVNLWLRMLKQILGEAQEDLNLERNAARSVEPMNLAEHQTYTFEEPNSLEPTELNRFLSAMFQRHPQYVALTALGFATGLRPSSLRPLRRRGEVVDVIWESNVILIRRSQTVGEDVMEMTKQGTRYRIALPEDVMRILKWHVDSMTGKRAESDLLFPGRHGGFLSPNALDKPFADVASHIGLQKQITPKGMRRTFQDLARNAQLQPLVQRAICGHSTEEMTELYSSVGAGEIREAVGKLTALAGYASLM